MKLTDISNEEMSILLDILQLDEIKTVCQAMNVNRRGLKPKLIADLVKLSAKKHSLFPGMKTPSSALQDKVSSMLGTCIRVPQTVEDLLNRIFILLIPHQDPEETMVEALNMLVLVHIGKKIFPPTPKKRFPIFRNRQHLVRWAQYFALCLPIVALFWPISYFFFRMNDNYIINFYPCKKNYTFLSACPLQLRRSEISLEPFT